METKWFRYPPTIQWTKSVCKIMIFVFAAVFVLMLFKNNPEDYETVTLYYLAFAMPIIMIFGAALYAGSWLDLGINDQGLVVEFLWFQLFVPWDSVVSVRHVGSMRFGVWVILTDKALTPLHRVYSIFTMGSFQPGIHAHSISPDHNSAIGLIRMNLKKVKRQRNRIASR